MKAGFPLLFILIFVFAASCKQEKEYLAEPLTEVTKPVTGQYFSYLDTITVEAEITHQQSIAYIEVAMINEYAAPVLPVLTFYPTGSRFSLKTSLIIDNRFIESGVYSVRIKTVIEGEVFNKWVKINYNAVPKRLESILFLTRGQGNLFRLIEVLSGNQYRERFTFSGDYTGSALSSGNRLFYTAGKVLNQLSAWNLEKNAIVWTVPAVPAPPLPYFTSIYSDGNEVFVSTRDGVVLGYAGSGSNTFRSKMFSNGYFTKMIRYKSWLMAVFEPFNSGFNELVMFNYPGGTVFRSVLFQGTVAGLADAGDDGILLFINGQSGSSAYQYSFDLNHLVNLRDFPRGNILDLTVPDSENAFISFDDGIYWYRPGISSIVKVLPDIDVSDMAFDVLSGTLFIASGATASGYQVPSFVRVGLYNTPESISDIHLLYNK